MVTTTGEVVRRTTTTAVSTARSQLITVQTRDPAASGKTEHLTYQVVFTG